MLAYEYGGVLGQPWGAAGFAWPPQLFWNNVPKMNSHSLNEMRAVAVGVESSKRVPILGCVAWGYEYPAAIGTGSPDNSNEGGWKEWGQWMKNHPQYYATQWWDETDARYKPPEAGYVTPMMPMEAADWPTEWLPPAGWVAPAGWVNNKPASRISYGQWLGVRLAQLALQVGCRGMYCADYVVDLEWGDAIDYNPRVVDDFAAWAKITIPPGTVGARADVIQTNHKSKWFDYKCTKFAEFYGSMAKNLIANGKVPLVGGQTFAPHKRGAGLDPRILIESSAGVAGKYYYFNIELQADELRPPKEYWRCSIAVGATAAREPDILFGGHMDTVGGQGSFDRSVKNAGHDTAWGLKVITQQWLSVGWTHIADRKGVVRRAIGSMIRSYWDAGTTPQTENDLILQHIPRHPFGPAVYYSVAIERTFENVNGKYGNNHWFCLEKSEREMLPLKAGVRRGDLRGFCTGYWVSDVGINALKPADYPSAWIVYDSDKLPAAERSRLAAIAPIIDPEKNFAAAAEQLWALGPVRVSQDSNQCLNCLAFVDQRGSVIIMVSNTLETAGSGSLMFTNVSNGKFTCWGLLGTGNATLTTVGNKGSIAVSVPARGTIVYEIPGLKWLGH
ncbi:MAG: hypothetical protein IPN40_05025 [Uliginosibacterium sp.]|nr:hypothetical protein [Uliginosibacterium sp.]